GGAFATAGPGGGAGGGGFAASGPAGGGVRVVCAEGLAVGVGRVELSGGWAVIRLRRSSRRRA
ncbi:hypothetical protein, partial [Rhizocola hellebori]|uniref:hypothetical protein n=1 Tax=Rhizocola hellebori TaxID=1392758 RepID=UPI001942D664